MNPSRFRALLATLRIANMPSVVCNVWLGIVLGLLNTATKDFSIFVTATVTLSLAGLLLYAAGNLLNDWKDRTWDQTSRPERALPRRLFRPSTYLTAAIICLALAIGLAATISITSAITAAVIAVNIAIYTHWHKGHAWSVIPMGLCRALLPVMGFLAVEKFWMPLPAGFKFLYNPSLALPDFVAHLPSFLFWIVPHSLALFLYIVGLSLSARAESRPCVSNGAMWIARTLIVSAVLSMALCWMPISPIVTLITLTPITAWLILAFTRLRKPVSSHVSALLAGIPLLDGVALFWLGTHTRFPDGAIAWINLTCFIIPIAAFLSGRLLQRIAPAT
jgi:heme O synthase-like polyprenyltransferase